MSKIKSLSSEIFYLLKNQTPLPEQKNCTKCNCTHDLHSKSWCLPFPLYGWKYFWCGCYMYLKPWCCCPSSVDNSISSQILYNKNYFWIRNLILLMRALLFTTYIIRQNKSCGTCTYVIAKIYWIVKTNIISLY